MRTSPANTDVSLDRRLSCLGRFFSLRCCFPACLRMTFPDPVTLKRLAMADRVFNLYFASMAVHTGATRGAGAAADSRGAALIPHRLDDSACSHHLRFSCGENSVLNSLRGGTATLEHSTIQASDFVPQDVITALSPPHSVMLSPVKCTIALRRQAHAQLAQQVQHARTNASLRPTSHFCSRCYRMYQLHHSHHV